MGKGKQKIKMAWLLGVTYFMNFKNVLFISIKISQTFRNVVVIDVSKTISLILQKFENFYILLYEFSGQYFELKIVSERPLL